MKILLLGEYSNVHATLALGLRELGHTVTVASNGDFWKGYSRDIDLARWAGIMGGVSFAFRLAKALTDFRGYDIVQLINPMFLEIKSEKLFYIYKYLRRHNRHLVLGAFGMDWYWVHTNTYNKPLRYSDFNIGDSVRQNPDAIKERKDWLNTPKEQLNKYIANDCDGIVAGLYEYWVCYHPVFPGKTTFIPFPIQMPLTEADCQFSKPLKLFIGINKSRDAYKGTDIMLRAAEAIVKNYPGRVTLHKAMSVPFCTYQKMMDGSDAILDQLYSYTPSMNPLLAMSKGIICIGGGEPENYAIIHEDELHPIVNVTPSYESVYAQLESLVLHPECIAKLKRDSVRYVRKHHDYLKVARQYATFYQQLTKL